MPARKHRPDKFGTPETVEDGRVVEGCRALVDKLLSAEAAKPGAAHWVSWLDMQEARILEGRRFLVEGNALGCFHLTPKAKMAWQPSR